MLDGLFNRRDLAKLGSNIGFGPLFHLFNKKSVPSGSGGAASLDFSVSTNSQYWMFFI